MVVLSFVGLVSGLFGTDQVANSWNKKNSIEAISSISFSVTRLTLKDFELQQEKNRVADPERFCYGSGSRSGSKFSESRILSRIQIRFLIRHFFFDNLKLWKNLTCWCFAAVCAQHLHKLSVLAFSSTFHYSKAPKGLNLRSFFTANFQVGRVRIRN